MDDVGHLGGHVEGALVSGLSQEHICGPKHVVPIRDQVHVRGTLLIQMRCVVRIHIVQVRLHTGATPPQQPSLMLRDDLTEYVA